MNPGRQRRGFCLIMTDHLAQPMTLGNAYPRLIRGMLPQGFFCPLRHGMESCMRVPSGREREAGRLDDARMPLRLGDRRGRARCHLLECAGAGQCHVVDDGVGKDARGLRRIGWPDVISEF